MIGRDGAQLVVQPPGPHQVARGVEVNVAVLEEQFLAVRGRVAENARSVDRGDPEAPCDIENPRSVALPLQAVLEPRACRHHVHHERDAARGEHIARATENRFEMREPGLQRLVHEEVGLARHRRRDVRSGSRRADQRPQQVRWRIVITEPCPSGAREIRDGAVRAAQRGGAVLVCEEWLPPAARIVAVEPIEVVPFVHVHHDDIDLA